MAFVEVLGFHGRVSTFRFVLLYLLGGFAGGLLMRVYVLVSVDKLYEIDLGNFSEPPCHLIGHSFFICISFN